MSKLARRRFTAEFKEQDVARLSALGATQSSVAKELGVTATQLKTWRLELEAAGSAEAVRRQQTGAAELAELRRENRRLREKVQVMRQTSAIFFCSMGGEDSETPNAIGSSERVERRRSPSSPPTLLSTLFG